MVRCIRAFAVTGLTAVTLSLPGQALVVPCEILKGVANDIIGHAQGMAETALSAVIADSLPKTAGHCDSSMMDESLLPCQDLPGFPLGFNASYVSVHADYLTGLNSGSWDVGFECVDAGTETDLYASVTASFDKFAAGIHKTFKFWSYEYTSESPCTDSSDCDFAIENVSLLMRGRPICKGDDETGRSISIQFPSEGGIVFDKPVSVTVYSVPFDITNMLTAVLNTDATTLPFWIPCGYGEAVCKQLCSLFEGTVQGGTDMLV